ncbi:adenosylhomocysteinase [Nitrososphaera viennensis]|uniref:Adenosylhomocysteinase n=1 Tax=Nitrososphaera viennensis TaxID=1034015 RepID=A0A977NL75_9ARCH|nr:adenosylhomocysteinase [Nitrososphaera viennensis]UVS68433.1 adenosylhomocysteinase [Nitrososphaera viennensis]
MPGKKIADTNLAQKGRLSHEWARARMSIIEKIVVGKDSKLLEGLTVGFCLHVTKETSVLVMAAKRLGAKVALCSANPLSVRDDIAAFLQQEGASVFAWRGETAQEYRDCIRQVLALSPQIVTDDGGDMHAAAHRAKVNSIIGGTEETTSGVKRLLALERSGRLMYPVIAVNNARTKYLFDNRHGTGQSTLDGIMRATGMFLPGAHVVVCGYGWVGKGVAAKARGMGAVVTVTEVDPVRALEARMDGFEVTTLLDAAPYGDLFVTCTGQTGVIRKEHFAKMKDGAILANTGHFDVEIDASFLYSNARPEEVRPGVERFDIIVAGGKKKKKLYLLSKGRVVNLVAAEGHPPEVMSLSFANQLMSILHVAKNYEKMERKVYGVPEEIDLQVAKSALDAMGVRIDEMTEEQKKYQNSG